jgi:phosphoglucosamine mutase
MQLVGVGDRYVLEEMLEHDYNFGGEQSGHLIFRDYATTGDGQLTAIQLLSLLKRWRISLSDAASVMRRFPQVIINVPVSADGKKRLSIDAEIASAIEKERIALGEEGRLLVRASGTEPLIRIMAEGMNEQRIGECAEQIARLIKARLSE